MPFQLRWILHPRTSISEFTLQENIDFVRLNFHNVSVLKRPPGIYKRRSQHHHPFTNAFLIGTRSWMVKWVKFHLVLVCWGEVYLKKNSLFKNKFRIIICSETVASYLVNSCTDSEVNSAVLKWGSTTSWHNGWETTSFLVMWSIVNDYHYKKDCDGGDYKRVYICLVVLTILHTKLRRIVTLSAFHTNGFWCQSTPAPPS